MYLKYYPFVPFFTMPGPVSFCRPFFVPLQYEVTKRV